MSVRRNIRIMYGISLLQGMVFYASIATLYRQQAGVSIFQITIIESISLVISIALEMPWGVVADRIGYRKSMIACSALWFASKIVFWQADGFGMFLLERVLLGVVFAGISGLDQSILYCSCEPEKAQGVFGVYSNLGTAGVLFASAVYSLYIGENYRLAGFLTMIAYGLAALLSLGLKEVKPAEAGRSSSLSSFKAAIGSLLKNRKLILLVVACALLAEVNQTITVFLNQPQYIRCGMTAAAIGAVYIGVTLLELTGGLSARLTKKFGARRMGGSIFAVCTAACVLLTVTKSAFLSVASVALIHGSASLLWPLKADLTNRYIDSPDRATALSANALLCDGIGIASNLSFGRLADWSLSAAMLFGAVLCAVGWVLFAKCQNKT